MNIIEYDYRVITASTHGVDSVLYSENRQILSEIMQRKLHLITGFDECACVEEKIDYLNQEEISAQLAVVIMHCAMQRWTYRGVEEGMNRLFMAVVRCLHEENMFHIDTDKFQEIIELIMKLPYPHFHIMLRKYQALHK